MFLCFFFVFCYCRYFFFFFSSRRRHTRYWRDWSSDVCSSDLLDGPAEGYVLDVDAGGVRVRAGTAEGLFHAEQKLAQLVEDGAVAPVHVEDRPRFAWRGAMLDVARHFLTADDVKAFVDDIAAYKLNVLHLHLTDDEGWRFPVASL